MSKKHLEPVNKGGRPRILVADEETLDKLKIIASGQHTQLEAASIFGVSLATFEGFLRQHEEARAIWDLGVGNGRASLRRMQFMAAQKGSVPMQIWLGKQYLGQKDKSEQTVDVGDTLKEVWAAIGEQRMKVVSHDG